MHEIVRSGDLAAPLSTQRQVRSRKAVAVAAELSVTEIVRSGIVLLMGFTVIAAGGIVLLYG